MRASVLLNSPTCRAVLLALTACGPPAAFDAGVEPGDAGIHSPVDAGSTDAGLADAGRPDAGPMDAGPIDAGPIDAGPLLGAPGIYTRTPDGGLNRSYVAHVPAGYDGRTPLPVILALHGGGGDHTIARQITCPEGDAGSPECLDVLAGARGYIVIYPDGTGMPVLDQLKTWNAGGGSNGWQCISGYACNQHIDEKQAFGALLADLDLLVHYDHHRVFATGHSNGAAMSHRLACELPDAIAGIAPVAGGNQYATIEPCTAPTPILEIHGREDPCWNYDGGSQSCADPGTGVKISIPETISQWVTRNGCTGAPMTTAVPDTTADGTTTQKHVYSCPAGHDVVFYEVTGGGHTWPGGYTRSTNMGVMSTDFSANRTMLDFFDGIP